MPADLTARLLPRILTLLPIAALALLAACGRPAPHHRPMAPVTLSAPRFDDAKPVDWPGRTPRAYAVHGIDISRWNTGIDWPVAQAAGVSFAFIKATEGGDHIDPEFRHHWAAARRAGVPRGAYHFWYHCRSGAEQADWFIRNVPREAGALPPVLDLEWPRSRNCPHRPDGAHVRREARIFLDRLEAHYGQRPIIYTAPDFYRDNLEGEFLDYPFWLRSVAAHPKKVYPGRKWVFWQYSGSGLSHGVEGKIDLNVFHGDEADWSRWVARHAG